MYIKIIYIFKGRSFYTTRFGKRSEADESANTESSTENSNAQNQDVPEAPARSGSSFYTTRFGRRSDPSWNGRALRPRQSMALDEAYEGQQDLDPYTRPSQQLMSKLLSTLKLV